MSRIVARERIALLLRPDLTDLRVIGLFTGRVLAGVGALMLVPAAAAALLGEHAEIPGFVIGASLALLTGLAAQTFLTTRRQPEFNHALVIAALAWAAAPLFGAVPLFLSGHFGTFLDAYFDAMSGFATAGLTVINDLDHLSDSVNLWRHTMQFVGGQGLVLLVLSVLAAGSGSAFTMYVAEAREEKILPNVFHTARFIGRVSLVWLLIATPVIWAVLVAAGMGPGAAVLHAINLFLAGFSTGGFAPQAASVGFYRSALLEGVLGVIALVGHHHRAPGPHRPGHVGEDRGVVDDEVGEDPAAGDVIRVRVRLEDVGDPKALLPRDAEVFRHAIAPRVHDDGLAGLGTADEVREAPGLLVDELLKDHRLPPTARDDRSDRHAAAECECIRLQLHRAPWGRPAAARP